MSSPISSKIPIPAIDDEDDDYFVYSSRWVMLSLFILSGVANALILLTWSPISNISSVFFGGIGNAAINMLTVLFQICYIPGTYMALTVSEKYDQRMLMICGGALTTIGCVIRWFGAFLCEQSGILNPTASYSIVFIGTLLVALAQPFYLNMPAKVAATWFNVRERDISTTLCSMANPIGSALGSAIPPFIVYDNGDGEVMGVSNLLLTQLAFSGIALSLILFLFKSQPPSPPSLSAARAIVDPDSKVTRKYSLKSEIGKLLSNVEYMKLFFAFSLALGNLNAVAALLNQLPGGFSNEQVGFTGFALILSGFVGAFLSGFLLEKTKAYRTILKASFAFGTLMWIVFSLSCRFQRYPLFITSAAFLGFTLLPIIPSTIVNSVECAHPVSEDLTVGLLYSGANTLAVGMTFIGQILLELPADSTGPSPLYPWAIWSVSLMLLGLLAILGYSGKYLRLEQDTIRPLLGGERVDGGSDKESDDKLERLRSMNSNRSSDF